MRPGSVSEPHRHDAGADLPEAEETSLASPMAQVFSDDTVRIEKRALGQFK
jgi:hypothetical protein